MTIAKNVLSYGDITSILSLILELEKPEIEPTISVLQGEIYKGQLCASK